METGNQATQTAATTTEGQTTQQAAATSQDQATGTESSQQSATSAAEQQQATEGQNTATAPAAQGEGGEQAEGEKAQGAPEKYEFTAAEGQSFDDAVIGAFSNAAKELNLSQDAAQKILDTVAPVMAQRAAEQQQALRAGWEESAKADKEFGGASLDQNLAVAKKALDAFASPELRTLLDESGLGSHPEMIRAFYRAGKAISEDRIVTGQGASTGRNDAKSMYPNSNMN